MRFWRKNAQARDPEARCGLNIRRGRFQAASIQIDAVSPGCYQVNSLNAGLLVQRLDDDAQ
jgi:hypothetical protein